MLYLHFDKKKILRCSLKVQVLIYLIKIWIWHVPKLDLDVNWIADVLVYLINIWVWHVAKVDSDVHRYHWY